MNALIFKGEPRNIESCSSSFSFLQSISDVCAHFYWDEDKIGEPYSGEQHGADYSGIYPIPELLPEIIESIYNPKYLLLEKPVNIPVSIKYATHPFFREYAYHNIKSCWYSMKRILEIVPDEYDWYFITRTDLKISSFPDLNSLDKNKIYVGPEWPHLKYIFKDNLYIVPRKYIHIFRELYDNYDFLFDNRIKIRNNNNIENPNPSFPDWAFFGEYVIPYQFMHHNILNNIVKTPYLLTEIVR